MPDRDAPREQDAPALLAETMFTEMERAGQSARRVTGDAEAERVRETLRELGRSRDVRLRTARMDDAVVVARLDARLWDDDRATMRAKLMPPD